MLRRFIILFVLTTGLMTGPALADARDEVIANMARCKAIADPRMWLDCYYGAAQPMRSQLSLSPAPAFQTNLVPGPTQGTPAQSPPSSSQASKAEPSTGTHGGFWTGLLGGPIIVNKVSAASYQFDRGGYFTVTLSNGQVWRQIQDDERLAKWNGPPEHYIVTVKEGAFGSYNLQVQGDSKQYKVRPQN
jgi:hypothetical protein